mmetsp:Transcript_4728/g.10410  ORF Transcript_4728/g.10410 Transcript_4728/m.10410 type:complete len:154 (-) Transcript_4728:22-483(-)
MVSSRSRRRFEWHICIAAAVWLCVSCKRAVNGSPEPRAFVAPLSRLSLSRQRSRQQSVVGRHSEPELKPALRGVPEAPSIEDDAEEDTILVYLLGGGIIVTGAFIGFLATENLTETSYFLPVIVCLGFSLAFTLGFGVLLTMKTKEKENKEQQ